MYIDFKKIINYTLTGGIMHRLFRLSFLVVLLGMLAITAGNAAKPTVYVSGRVDASDVRVFVKDSSYYVNNEYIIDGTLIIEPGTDIYFHPNGRMVIARGGRVLADGDAKTTYNSRPGGIDPLGTPYSSSNPKGFAGYADFRYFLYNYQPSGNTGPTTITVNTLRDVTVNRDKYNYIYNIVIDTSIIDPLSADTTYKNRHRRLQNLIIGQEPIPDNPEVVGVSYPEPVSGKIIVPFEYALMFVTSRLQS
ncbi:MAG: hypothetical protein QG635_1088, partial [Bacteroidota bacterium]|nr:hypothetical protein [Bacteroidota bacterium]